MKRPPKTTDSDFPRALAAWLQDCPWTEREVQALTGITQSQLWRWKARKNPPTGSAAARWDAFAEGRLPDVILEEIAELTAQVKKISKIAWDPS